ncbi:hypothetical protein M1D80_14065 [Phyllobacteriaceae bacterium JZ32]
MDFLGMRAFVNRNRIGAMGVCGSGSFVISAAKIDPRMRAIATVSMYDTGAANRNALNHSLSVEQRYSEFEGGQIQYTGGTDLELTASTHPIQRDFYDFYRTPAESLPRRASPTR